MEGSFSFERPQDDVSVPRRTQFAPERSASAHFQNPVQRRRYIEEQERTFTPFSEKLAEMRRRDERALRAEEDAQEDAEIVDRYARSLDWQHIDESDYGNPADALEQELEILERRLVRTPRKRSEGEYAEAASHFSPTYGDSGVHTRRIHLGPDRAAQRQVNEQLESVYARRGMAMQERYQDGARFSRRATNEWRVMDRELQELERSLEALKKDHLRRQSLHAYAVDNAALRHSDQPPRSHITQPSKPRGDGRTIRRWNEM